MTNNKNKNNKEKHNHRNPAVWHFPAANEINSDIFGSYTGTPLMPERTADTEDCEPEQDADDL